MPSSRYEKKSSKADKKFLKELKKKEKKRKKEKEREKEKEKKRAKYRSETSSESESDISDMDLDEEVHPISHYVNDRPEMITQVFATITGSKLRSMLPPSLVDLDIDDLKAICLDQLIGMSKRRLQHVLAGQEMLESSGSDSDTEDENKAGDSDSDNDAFQSIVKNSDGKGTVKRTHKIAFGKKEAEVPVKKVILSVGNNVAKDQEKEKPKKEEAKEEEGEHGRTLMELLELEMRARAIKALLMKAGKDEGEAETLAIEEALDEQKKKGEEKGEDKKDEEESPKERNLRKREDSDDEDKSKEAKPVENSDGPESRVFNSENKSMNKAREMLLLSENKKMIETEIKSRKEQEALFLYEEQMRKEQMEKDRIERERLLEEAKERKRMLVEKEQEERRQILDKEREKMMEDHKRKEEMKKNKDKEKLLSKIRAMKEAEEKEKEALEEHHKTKMTKKTIEREDDEVSEDKESEEAKRKYRKKEDAKDLSGEEGTVKTSRVRKQYDRDDQEKKKGFSRSDDTSISTRPKRKVVGGSDVEDGEVEDVNSDAEDEIDREDENEELLQKMKNLKNKISTKMEKESASGYTPPESSGRGRGGRGRGRSGRGRGRGEVDKEWSLNKYDFEAPDIAEKVKDHKPNLLKKEPKSSDGVKRVTRDEWDKMSRDEKKDYMKQRKKRKMKDAVYIKDDSDNEQLVSSGSEGEEELELPASEDEKDKDERLAKAALKSYAQSFTAAEHPEDYQLVMRKDVWEKELAADAEEQPLETLEDIERQDKIHKVESKAKEKKEKLRAERLKRMQAFQASSILQHQQDEDDQGDEKEDSNPFYSSYEEAIIGDGKVDIEDPLKEERLKRQREIEEDEAALRELEQEKQQEADEEEQKTLRIQAKLDAKKRKMAELALMKSRKRPDPNNPSKEELDAAQELTQVTWEDRWKKDQKLKEVFTSSKLLGKAKLKMKMSMSGSEEKKSDSKSEVKEDATSIITESVTKDADNATKETEKLEDDDPCGKDLPGMIGSVDEYATILGKTAKELTVTEEKFQPPEVSDSEGEDSPVEDEGDLWGAIMGAP